jgi:hypothetical protein
VLRGVVNMIKQYNNVLNEELIKDMTKYFESMLRRDAWSSSSGWDQSLSLISTNTLTHQITDKILKKEIKRVIEEVIDIDFNNENLEFSPSIYVWSGGSYINWHTDYSYPYNGTIYLNKEWDTNNGGVFLYKENDTNQIRGIEPTYNSMIVNSKTKNDPHNNHCVTCIVPGTIKKRVTLQWRTFNKEKKYIVYR